VSIPIERKQSKFVRNVIEFIGLLGLVFLVRTFGFGLYQVPSGSMETTMLVGERFAADKCTYLFRAPKRGEIIAFNDTTYAYSTGRFMNLFEHYVYGPSNITKRVIGLPGDIVEGKVEDNKPVIYINGQKLDEPYLNKYPLLNVYCEDKNVLIAQIDREISGLLRGRAVDPIILDTYRVQKLAYHIKTVSYDAAFSYSSQPFYRVKSDRIVTDMDGNPLLIYPDTVVPQSIERITRGKSYWQGSDDFYVELAEDEFWVMGDNRLGSKDSRWFGPIKHNLIHGRIVFRIWSVNSDESWWILDLMRHPIDFWQRVRWSRFFQILS